MTTDPRETIEELSGRGNLSRAELLTLAEARRAIAPQCEATHREGIERCILAAGHAGPHTSPWGKF